MMLLTLSTEEALQMVDAQKEEFNRPHSFWERMLCAYMSWGKAAHNLNDNHHQKLAKVSSFSFEASTRGRWCCSAPTTETRKQMAGR